ncbi:rhodanese-like domain-containing protein [Rhodocyclus tenuis]|uniref:Rhodanese-like domain-containing protein n=2 Tax=Rhodocyclus TaxID=1064 RepID=A0A6L5JV61_RHOTE|nr:rhodanese-like domain-containing protein [Rhodocyclus gracilis]MQY50702.1 rhodanese-like domain-containing protein [Rhodocyclus gracilis]MRD72705.1 rhodanese-like domain-containing protein [Rhodocyclus gracilis]NJA88232.1 rhodanese-like domain-containing protein [Rhodocyclus gracilis]
MEFIQQNLLLVAIAVTSGAMLLATFIRRPGGKGLSPTQATLLINREDALTIDVREPAEFTAGHVADSRNIPAGQIKDRLTELEKFKERPLILICQSGARSATACAQLTKAGFTKVHSLDGGIDAWVQGGLPIRKGARK